MLSNHNAQQKYDVKLNFCQRKRAIFCENSEAKYEKMTSKTSK
jgi:hypothetical protein